MKLTDFKKFDNTKFRWTCDGKIKVPSSVWNRDFTNVIGPPTIRDCLSTAIYQAEIKIKSNTELFHLCESCYNSFLREGKSYLTKRDFS